MKYSGQITRAWQWATLLSIALLAISCAGDGDSSHTTVTTYVTPPPHQSLTVISRPQASSSPSQTSAVDPTADATKPLLLFHLENGKTFRVGEQVPVYFTVLNAKLRGEGGNFRVRYIVDDDDMQWLDKTDSFGLTGWVPGKHTIRMELIGPDGWVYRNGNANVVIREITVQK